MHARRSARPSSVLVDTNDSPSLISGAAAPPVTDSLVPCESVQDFSPGDAGSNAVTQQPETSQSVKKIGVMPYETDPHLQPRKAPEAALASNASYLMTPSAHGNLSQFDGTTTWDAPVPDTSGSVSYTHLTLPTILLV